MPSDNANDNLALNFIQKEMKEMVGLRDSFKTDQLKFVKNLINPDLSDTELYLFLMFAGKIGLNPFKKEIIAVVYHKDDANFRRVGYIVTRDGKMVVGHDKITDLKVEAIYTKKIKEASGQEIAIPVEPWDGTLWGAQATCQRDGKLYKVIVPLSEYDTGKNVWATKKSTMIKKVAQSQLLSMAVPELLGGVYEEEEMPELSLSAKPSKTPKAEKTEEPKKEEELNDKVDALPDGDKPATDDQIASLKAMGVDPKEGLTRQEAAEKMKAAAIDRKAEK